MSITHILNVIRKAWHVEQEHINILSDKILVGSST